MQTLLVDICKYFLIEIFSEIAVCFYLSRFVIFIWTLDGRDMSDCSQKMLSQTLKRLEQIGLVARQVYPEVPPRVEYYITELGKSLMPHVIGLMEWAAQNFENIVRDEGDL